MGRRKCMKVIVAIDSLKGSLSSLQAGAAAKAGILRAIPAATVSIKPVADGGEGTVTALVSGLSGRSVRSRPASGGSCWPGCRRSWPNPRPTAPRWTP